MGLDGRRRGHDRVGISQVIASDHLNHCQRSNPWRALKKERPMKRLVLSFAIAALVILRVTPTHGADPTPTAAHKPAVYNESADAKADAMAAEARAARDNKRVLLQIGGNWCHWCLLLNDLCT